MVVDLTVDGKKKLLVVGSDGLSASVCKLSSQNERGEFSESFFRVAESTVCSL